LTPLDRRLSDAGVRPTPDIVEGVQRRQAGFPLGVPGSTTHVQTLPSLRANVDPNRERAASTPLIGLLGAVR